MPTPENALFIGQCQAPVCYFKVVKMSFIYFTHLTSMKQIIAPKTCIQYLYIALNGLQQISQFGIYLHSRCSFN